MKFFIDHNLPALLAKSLDSLSKYEGQEYQVVHLTEKFPSSISDADWISALAREGDWIVITQDRLSKNPTEKLALRESKLTSFFLKKAWSGQKFWPKAYQLTRWWPSIIQQAQSIAPGATFRIPFQFSGKGKFEQFNF